MWRSWEEVLDLFTRAERSGYDAAFVTDHLLSDWDGEDGAVLEAWTMLGALAREVSRILIGTYVTGITHRYPALLAKQAATVDHLSGGRLILGVGAAWNEREHRAFGMPFPPPRARVDLVGETLEAMRRLEEEGRVSYRGDHLTLDDAPFVPKPVNGHIPILIGSRGRRMLRHVAAHADYWDLADCSEDAIGELASIVAGHCRTVGRDPDDIVWMHEEVASGDDPGGDLVRRVERLAPRGVSFFLVNCWPRSDPGVVERVGAAISLLRRPHPEAQVAQPR